MYPPIDPVSTYRILGIDPGTDTLGVALIDVDLCSLTMGVTMAHTLVATSELHDYRVFAAIHGKRAARLRSHEDNLFYLMRDLGPHFVICEDSYMKSFALPYRALVECVDSVRQAAYRYNPAMCVALIDPTSVKKVAGVVGKMVGKDTVAAAIGKQADLLWSPHVDASKLDEHSMDAVAVAHVKAREVIVYLRTQAAAHAAAVQAFNLIGGCR